MMTVKLKLATYLRIILTLNKLTNNNFRKLSSSTFTDLTACQNKKKGRDNVKKKKGLSTVNKKDFRNANNAQNITMMDFEKLIIYVKCKS